MDIFSPIQWFADLVSYGWLNLGKESYLGSAANFFVYDLIKIGILLLIINYVMAITRYYLPIEKIKNILTKRRWFGLEYLFAALLGVVTPFCSCSSIPLFIGFVGAGIPLGVTFTFLIASPLLNEASLYLFPSMFGINVAIIYNLLGIIVAILGGMLIQRLKLDKYVKRELLKIKTRAQIEKEHGGKKLTLKELVTYWWTDGWAITKQVFPYVVLGVGVGALIHGFVPISFVEQYLSSKEWWAVPMAVLLGAPLYANSISVIPIMEAIVGKGVPLGTALAFMTSIVTIIGIIIMGYVLNMIV
jgi:uncharacterized membrane protein YraQ (UPF0718 family)